MLLLHETNPKMPAEVAREVSAPFAAWNDSVPYFFLFFIPFSLFLLFIYPAPFTGTLRFMTKEKKKKKSGCRKRKLRLLN